MLHQHEFYVYHEGNEVYARWRGRERVLARTCDSPQAAHDFVQSIVNPSGKHHTAFGPKGFHSPEFQGAISGHCEAFVREAYAAQGQE